MVVATPGTFKNAAFIVSSDSHKTPMRNIGRTCVTESCGRPACPHTVPAWHGATGRSRKPLPPPQGRPLVCSASLIPTQMGASAATPHPHSFPQDAGPLSFFVVDLVGCPQLPSPSGSFLICFVQSLDSQCPLPSFSNGLASPS